MRVIYENKNIVISFDKDKKLMEYRWTTNTEHSSMEDNVSSFREAMNKIIEYKPERILSNSLDFKGVIDIDLQYKIVESIHQAMNAVQAKKIAFLFPEEMIAHLSYDQAKEEADTKFTIKDFESNFYDSYEEAIAWLSGD